MANTKITSRVIADNSVGIDALNVSDGTNGQALVTDGSGGLSFSTISGYTDSDVETYLNTSEIYTDATNNRLGIGTNSPGSILDIRETNSGGVGPTLSLINGASVANGNAVDINMAGNPGGGALAPTGRIRLTEDAGAIPTLGFHLYDGSGLGERMTLRHIGGTTLKLSGYASMLRLTSGAGAVFGHNVEATSNANEIIQSNTGYYGSFIKMYYNNGIAFHTMSSAGTTGDVIDSPSVTGTERMKIDSSGRVTTPAQPAFRAQQGAASGLGAGSTTMGFDDTVTGTFDIGGNFNNSTNRFTAPVAGIYHFNASIRCDSMNAYFRISIVKNGAANYYTNNHAIYGVPSGNYENLQVGGILNLAANDYVTVVIYAVSDTSWNSQGEGYFSGYLVG